MPRVKPVADVSLLSAALAGLEARRQKIEEQIAHVRSLLGKRRGRPPGSGLAKAGGKRRLSAAARKRIADAQKRRWAAYRKRRAAGRS